MFLNKQKFQIMLIKRNMKFQDLAKAVGLSRQILYDYMGRYNIKKENLQKIASVLECKEKELL